MLSGVVDNEYKIRYHFVALRFTCVYKPLQFVAVTFQKAAQNGPRAGRMPTKQLNNQARMAELADALDSGSSAGNGVQVQVLLRARVLGEEF
jgi:hypothetical protein